MQSRYQILISRPLLTAYVCYPRPLPQKAGVVFCSYTLIICYFHLSLNKNHADCF
jgi:hypothetical protein